MNQKCKGGKSSKTMSVMDKKKSGEMGSKMSPKKNDESMKKYASKRIRKLLGGK